MLISLQTAYEISRGSSETFPQTNPCAPQSIGGEMLRLALEAILMEPHADDGLDYLQHQGILKTMLPEVEATVDFTQEAGRLHKDVWKHTKQVILQCPVEPILRWTALFHDIGKVPTRIISPDGKVSFHRHAEVGARMFDNISRRLGFPKSDYKDIRFLIYHHLRGNQYESSWTDSAVRRFAKEMGTYLDRLLAFSRADITSGRPLKRENSAKQIDEFQQRINAIQEMDRRIPPLPSGLGNEIMERFHLSPGKQVGVLREYCESAIETGEIEAYQNSTYYLDYLEKTYHKLNL